MARPRWATMSREGGHKRRARWSTVSPEAKPWVTRVEALGRPRWAYVSPELKLRVARVDLYAEQAGRAWLGCTMVEGGRFSKVKR